MEKSASDLKNDEKEFLTLLGFLYLRYGKFDKAGILFEALHTLFPAEPYFCRALCFAYLKIEEFEKALGQANRLIETSSRSDDQEVGHLLKSKALWHLGEKEEAKECIKEGLGLRALRLRHEG